MRNGKRNAFEVGEEISFPFLFASGKVRKSLFLVSRRKDGGAPPRPRPFPLFFYPPNPGQNRGRRGKRKKGRRKGKIIFLAYSIVRRGGGEGVEGGGGGGRRELSAQIERRKEAGRKKKEIAESSTYF